LRQVRRPRDPDALAAAQLARGGDRPQRRAIACARFDGQSTVTGSGPFSVQMSP
jgi:hypothetical protein